MNKFGIAVEGESDRKILKEIFEKLNINIEDDDIKLPTAHSGGKDQLYKNMQKLVSKFSYRYKCIIFLVDYDNSEDWAEKFKTRKDEIQRQNPQMKIYLHFAKQEIESWLLGCYDDSLKEAKNEEPDNVSDPVKLLEKCIKKKEKNNEFKYNKSVDGQKIAGKNELKHFEHSKSFKEFRKILENLYKI